jgi:membrane protein
VILKHKKHILNALNHFMKSDGWAMASHVALSIMMALFPFLIFATSLAGFLGYDAQSDAIVDIVFETWPDEVADPIIQEIRIVLSEYNIAFLSVGIGLSLIFASSGVGAVRTALTRAYRIQENRSPLFCHLQSLLYVICGALLLLVNSILVMYTPQIYSSELPHFTNIGDYEFPLEILRMVFAFGTLMFAVFACHAWLLSGRRPISQIWSGIVLTLVLSLVATGIFTKYLKLFADYGAIYAGLAGVMTAQIFLYLMAVILILGGEWNAALLRERSRLSADKYSNNSEQ